MKIYESLFSFLPSTMYTYLNVHILTEKYISNNLRPGYFIVLSTTTAHMEYVIVIKLTFRLSDKENNSASIRLKETN